MPARIETITCNFIGDFKVGDNMWRNADALCRMSASNDGVYNKLMVIQAGSLVEAALDQIIYRAQNYVREGIPNIAATELKQIRDSKIDRFNNIIQAMEKHKLLSGLGDQIYKELHLLRQYRNRVHIQFDDEPPIGRDDHVAFANNTVAWSLDLCVKVLKHLGERYPRPPDLAHFAHNISIPLS